MTLVRVNVSLDPESKRLLQDEAASHHLSLSKWLRVVAQILKLPAPPDLPVSVLRGQIHQLVETERLEDRRNRSESFRSMTVRALADRDGWKCHWCGRVDCERWAVDHVVPISKGGHTEMANLVLSCPKCNGMKGANIWTKAHESVRKSR